MKSVSTTFSNTIQTPTIQVIRQIAYKRRYWNGSAYVWESNWTALPETSVIGVSAITAQLDTQSENEFQISTTTITLVNFQNQWVLKNPQSIFGPDTNSPVYGYVPNYTKFQINAGLVYPGGSTELVTLFTGVATDFNFNSTDSQVQVTLSGEQIFLVNTNAQTVSNTATLESIGTGDGSTKIFSTAHTGVGIILGVYVAGVLQTPGTAYSISNTDVPTSTATITFVTAPAARAAITCSYVYWFQGQKFETLVADLATASGIASGNQQISPVSFPNSVINSHTYQTQADWNSGTLSNADTATFPNTIHADWTKALALTTYAGSLSGWTTNLYGTGTIAWAIVSGALAITSSGGSGSNGATGTAYRSQPSGVGAWQWTTGATTGSSSQNGYWCFMAGAVGNYTNGGNTLPVGINGYGIRLAYNNTSSTIYLIRYGATPGHPGTVGTTIASATGTLNGSHTIKVSRTIAGIFNVSVDGTVVITATDTTYSASNYFVTYSSCDSVSTTAQPTAALYFPAPVTSSWQSPTFDSGATPTAWTNAVINDTPLTSSFAYQTRSSPDGTTWSSWVTLPGSRIVASPLNRYFQIDWTGTILTDGNDPFLSSITVGSTTSSTVITLADFTGQTCYEAIQSLAGMANYEFGFDAVENFFFRPKSASLVPVMSIDQSTFVIDVLSQTTGADRAYSSVVVTYGAYIAEVNDPGGAPTSPSAIYGYSQLQPNSSGFLLSADANVATGMAQALFAFWSVVRSSIKIATTFLPQLDLSDIINLTFHNNAPDPGWYWGDPDVYWGMPGLYYYGANNQLLDNVVCKVVGYRIDTDDWSCEYDLEEMI